MGLGAGSRLGPYEIVSPAGAGGMGEVYKARDTRLDRTVAIKILPSYLASSPDLKQRFEREAKAISSLQHPHICTLFDVGSQDGADFLVLEYLEGDNLADRLAKGALPLEQVLKIGIEIAQALDKAHRQGLVHRDLKPGNIMLTAAGAKLMDFGLAKPVVALGLGAAGPLTPSTPTMSVAALSSPASPLTQKGQVVGTFQYLAPEVLQGAEADTRADIFAFGAVLYEMVTGRRAFEGKSQLSVMTSILEKNPDPIAQARPDAPPGLEHLIASCLAKDPELRWQTAHDLGLQLRWLTQAGSGRAAAPARLFSRRWTWAAAALLAVAGVVLGYFLRPHTPAPIIRTSISLPQGVKLEMQDSSLALSPDGRRLVFAGVDRGGKQQLWLRSLDGLAAQPLSGTDGATYPFWSPDSRFIGFFAGHQLKKLDASSGIVQALCDAADGRGASWGTGGTIVFSAGPYSPLYGVSAAGGAPSPLTTLSGKSVSHRVPHFLPDGVHVLFYSTEGTGLKQHNGGIFLLDVPSKRVTLVSNEESEARYAAGYILFLRKRNLMAQRFDTRRLRPVGEAVPIAERILFNPFRYTGAFSVSDSGLLVYQSGSMVPQSQLTWFDLDGNKLGVIGEPAAFGGIFLAPNGKQMVAPVVDPSSNQINLWMYDLARGIPSRFTFGSGDFDNPVWSPDSRSLAFEDSSGKIFIKPADSSSQATELFADGGFNMPTLWSADPRTLLYCVQTSQGMDLWSLTLAPKPEPHPFIVTGANECNGTFSPNGKWLAYISDETGRNELYVVSFPVLGAKRQLSADGADHPNWFEDGRRLAYVNAEQRLVILDVAGSGRDLEVGKPRTAFGGAPLPGLPRQATGVDAPVYISRDGKRMLLPVPIGGGSMSDLTLVSSWAAELKK